MISLRTAFIDNQVLLVQGIKSLLEQNGISGFEVKDHYVDLPSFLENEEDTYDLIISDLNIQDPDIVDHVPKVKKRHPNSRVIVLTNYDNFKLVRDTMKAGADGYLSKKTSFAELIKCIEEVMDGKAHVGKGLKLTPSRKLFENQEEKQTESSIIRKYEDRFQVRQKLTKRELEILKLVTEAKSNKEIAGELFISDQTVGVHKKNIMRKLNVRTTLSLIKYAMEQNLV